MNRPEEKIEKYDKCEKKQINLQEYKNIEN